MTNVHSYTKRYDSNCLSRSGGEVERRLAASHDLRNLLMAMSGHLPSLRAAQVDVYEALALSALIERARDVAERLEQPRDAKPHLIDVRLSLARLAPLLRGLVPRASTFHLKTEAVQRVRATDEDVHAVLINLVANAGQAVDVGGSVGVSLRRAGESRVELEISNTGVALDRAVVEGVFGGPAESDARTGVGLAIVRDGLARIGAGLEIRVGPTGTSFVIEFEGVGRLRK